MITNIVLCALVACDPELTRQFTPLHPQLGRYDACAAAEPLHDAAAAARGDGFQLAAVEELEPLDVFGAAGSYDRAAVVRLYGGRRVKVMRGWRQNRGGFESVTLISPYPDVSLSRLQGGTLWIRWLLTSPP